MQAQRQEVRLRLAGQIPHREPLGIKRDTCPLVSSHSSIKVFRNSWCIVCTHACLFSDTSPSRCILYGALAGSPNSTLCSPCPFFIVAISVAVLHMPSHRSVLCGTYVLKGHSGNIFGGVFSSWVPCMAPKEWGIAKTRPKKSIYEAREGQVCLLF